ncbi:hypothetical protein [Mucilaginibacter pedocola]|uniref:DUF4412 domain-containing protein n=1 Tax=Mucilaginibacter pedocola TaxID=1792845 RepID=A0A1S9P9E9_9SPHI|nr:hypothetical protein [Mucilaginibacter pedocola]OOQ57539.1 hypothetical protein BC343_12065 [Mucilaginibacter pedocola]
MLNRTLFIAILLLGSARSFAQTAEKYTPALLETKSGAKVVYTSQDHSIIFDIHSDKIIPTEKEGVLSINKKVFQYILIPNGALSMTDTSEARQKAELLGYMEYETSYAKKELKISISNITQKWLTINNKLFLLWGYNMPQDNQAGKNADQLVLRQVNLSTRCFGAVLNLNSPTLSGETEETNSPMLTEAAKTLQLSNVKTDLPALYKKLQEEMKQ